jgi:hypothetical protein
MTLRTAFGLSAMTETMIVSTTVDVPAAAVFAVLADPATHSAIDGTGWVREPLDGERLTRTGQMFRMAMYHDNHPDKHYEMANKVISFHRDRTVGWEPGQAGADGEVEFGGWTWRYDLEPVGPQQTRVTLTYDCLGNCASTSSSRRSRSSTWRTR